MLLLIWYFIFGRQRAKDVSGNRPGLYNREPPALPRLCQRQVHRGSMKISTTIEIGNSPGKIFYWLEDPARAMTWMTSVSRTEIVKETPNMIGTTFRELIEENGRGTEMRGEVTDFVLNKRLAFHLEGEFNSVEVSYTLEEKGETTSLTQNAEIHFKGLLRVLGIFFGPIFKKRIIHQARGELAKLKEFCEQDVQY